MQREDCSHAKQEGQSGKCGPRANEGSVQAHCKKKKRIKGWTSASPTELASGSFRSIRRVEHDTPTPAVFGGDVGKEEPDGATTPTSASMAVITLLFLETTFLVRDIREIGWRMLLEKRKRRELGAAAKKEADDGVGVEYRQHIIGSTV
jgi:hypothetical protein